MHLKQMLLILACSIVSTTALAQAAESAASVAAVAAAQEKAESDAASDLAQFGFGPALFIIGYDDEILEDTKDVTLRGDGSIAASGSDYSVTLGVEAHYDFSFNRKVKCSSGCEDPANWNLTSSHRLSPFVGFFDVDNGINGMAAGLIYGYTKGDGVGQNKATLNFGVGRVIHKSRLVLSGDVHEGAVPAANLNAADYTERKDVSGTTLMISVNFGF